METRERKYVSIFWTCYGPDGIDIDSFACVQYLSKEELGAADTAAKLLKIPFDEALQKVTGSSPENIKTALHAEKFMWLRARFAGGDGRVYKWITEDRLTREEALAVLRDRARRGVDLVTGEKRRA